MFTTKKKDASGQDSTEKIVGYFKGIIEVESKEDKANYRVRKEELLELLIDKLARLSQKTG